MYFSLSAVSNHEGFTDPTEGARGGLTLTHGAIKLARGCQRAAAIEVVLCSNIFHNGHKMHVDSIPIPRSHMSGDDHIILISYCISWDWYSGEMWASWWRLRLSGGGRHKACRWRVRIFARRIQSGRQRGLQRFILVSHFPSSIRIPQRHIRLWTRCCHPCIIPPCIKYLASWPVLRSHQDKWTIDKT